MPIPRVTCARGPRVATQLSWPRFDLGQRPRPSLSAQTSPSTPVRETIGVDSLALANTGGSGRNARMTIAAGQPAEQRGHVRALMKKTRCSRWAQDRGVRRMGGESAGRSAGGALRSSAATAWAAWSEKPSTRGQRGLVAGGGGRSTALRKRRAHGKVSTHWR